MTSTRTQRTQMYLDPEDHRRLRRLAADRGASMTSLVREAVARYLVEEGATELPSMDELAAGLEGQGRYAGCTPGPAGLVTRMRRREEHAVTDGKGAAEEAAALSRADRELGEAPAAAVDRDVAAWDDRARLSGAQRHTRDVR